MYAAAALNSHNPWFPVMPDLTGYLQRVSYALRQGEPANDVALLLPNDDVWSNFKASFLTKTSPTSFAGFDETGSNVSMDEEMDGALGKQVIAQVLDAGFNVDFIDADVIDSVGIPYRILVLPAIDRLPVATYERVVAFARKGGIVLATGRMPATAPGLVKAAQDSARLKELSEKLFGGEIASAHFVPDETQLGSVLAKYALPDMTLTPATPAIGFIHRKLLEGDLYFIANTSNEAKHVRAKFRDSAKNAESWDAFSSEISGVSDPNNIQMNLEPYESRLIFFSDAAKSAPKQGRRVETVQQDLSRHWKVTFGKTNPFEDIDRLASWSDAPKTRFYSGLATYEKSFEIVIDPQESGTKFLLDFGTATPESLPSPPGEHNMRAYVEAPIRDAAQVCVNGKLVGVLWHPPYRLDVTQYVHNGSNDVRVEVGNTAINELAGKPMPDFRLLWDRYGMRFVPQGMENLQPLPSGLLGPVRLVKSTPED